MSDYAKLIEEWEKAKKATDNYPYSRDDRAATSLMRSERLAARSVVDALVAALNCEECGGKGVNWNPHCDGTGDADWTPCPKCSPTRELARGGGR